MKRVLSGRLRLRLGLESDRRSRRYKAKDPSPSFRVVIKRRIHLLPPIAYSRPTPLPFNLPHQITDLIATPFTIMTAAVAPPHPRRGSPRPPRDMPPQVCRY
jgi:hypothetical protein